MKIPYLLILALLAGCSLPPGHLPAHPARYSTTEYSQDFRTGLCFMNYDAYYNPAYTNVPCTPEVLIEIARQKQEAENVR